MKTPACWLSEIVVQTLPCDSECVEAGTEQGWIQAQRQELWPAQLTPGDNCLLGFSCYGMS